MILTLFPVVTSVKKFLCNVFVFVEDFVFLSFQEKKKKNREIP